RLQQIIHRRENLVIIGVRFAYGLRTIGPVIIGAAGVNPLKFFVLNILGGAIWGSVIVSAGYFVSAAILALPLHTYLAWFLILAAVAGLFMLIRKHKLKM
ncbi:DedA family protein, partial [Morganella morganii]